MLDPEASFDIIIKVQGLGLEFDTTVKELNHWSLHMWAYTIKQHNMFKKKKSDTKVYNMHTTCVCFGHVTRWPH
jgi:hypothetical protein